MTVPDLSYWTVQPDRFTFGARKIREWVEERLSGDVLNACCGPTRLDHDSVHRNDKQQAITYTDNNGVEQTAEINPDTQYDIRALNEHLDTQFDVIIYDPPFSANQAEKSYNLSDGTPIGEQAKAALDDLLKPGGIIIQFGYSAMVGAPLEHYRTEEVALWNLLGGQYDWFSVVARKPDDVTRATPSAETASESVLPNANANATGSVTRTGNGGQRIQLDYKQLPASADLETAIADYLETQLGGNVLQLTGQYRGVTLPDSAWRVGVDGSRPFILQLDKQTIGKEFADSFYDTVVLDLESEAFQRQQEYEGTYRVEASFLKDEVYPLVRGGGSVIQVGHTATNIPSRLNCTRAQVGIFAHPDAARDWIVVRDNKPNSNLSAWTSTGDDESEGFLPGDVPADIRDHAPRSQTNANYICTDCDERWYRHPAWYATCPDCGANPDNYCVTSNGNLLREPHPARAAVVERQHTLAESDSIEETSTDTPSSEKHQQRTRTRS